MYLKFSMLSFFIVLYALIGVQGKAFPSRYKRNYEGSYHYIPYEEGILHIPAGYSPENLPNYQDYLHPYVQTNGHDWTSYYQSMLPQPIHHPYSNINQKIKAKHNWHFIDQTHVPVTRYTDGVHFESGVEAPNVIEALVKKDIDRDDKYEAPVVVEALIRKNDIDRANAEVPVELTVKEMPINSKYDGNAHGTKPSAYYMYEPIEKQIKDDAFFSSNEFDLSVVVDSLDKISKPSKIKPVAIYEAFELPVLDSLTKEKPDKVKPVASYEEFELPVVVDSLTKDKPDKVKPVASYEEFELPAVVDSLAKVSKAYLIPAVSIYESFRRAVVDSLTKDKPDKVKPVVSYEEFELPVVVDSLTKKDKPEKVKPVASYEKFELPVVVDSLGKKGKPIKLEPVVSYAALELPIVDSLTKKDKPIKVETDAPYAVFKLSLVESLTKNKPVELELTDSYSVYKPIKEKPIKEKPIKEKPIKEKPIKEKPIKEKPIKEKPIKEKPISHESLDYPFTFDSLNKMEQGHETPVVIEALVRKERPTLVMEDEHELPIVVEALVRRPPPLNENKKINEDKMLQKGLLHSLEGSILTKNTESLSIPAIETMTFEQDTESAETPKQQSIIFDENHGLNVPEMDGFEENEQGSATDFDRSRFARSFFPVDSNIFPIVTNMQEQERRKFKKCSTPKNETGNCMPFQLCSVSSAVINVDELLRNVCLIDEVFLGVCCPEFPVETVRVDWEQLNPDSEKINEEKSSQIPKECGRLPLRVTDQDPWPWMASLIAKSSDKVFCGGVLVAEQFALTAAHCTVRIPKNQILVRLGRPDSENLPEPDFEVIEIKRHAGYNPRTMQNDIALLKLSRRVKLAEFRGVVCLAKDEEGIEHLVSKSASLLRWKGTPGEIKDVEPLTVISTQECQSRMQTAIADSILCTEPRTDETMCNADSGAPLIISKDDKFEVIGILTWNRNDCDERFPTVFTRVSSYHGWIEKLAS